MQNIPSMGRHRHRRFPLSPAASGMEVGGECADSNSFLQHQCRVQHITDELPYLPFRQCTNTCCCQGYGGADEVVRKHGNPEQPCR